MDENRCSTHGSPTQLYNYRCTMHMILGMSILHIRALNDDANQILGYDVKNDTSAIELHKIPSTLPI